jgi:hypothetical protein
MNIMIIALPSYYFPGRKEKNIIGVDPVIGRTKWVKNEEECV